MMTVSGCPSWACVHHMNGCVNGVAIDIDEYTEGWQRDVVYPVAPCHPRYCETCHGTGEVHFPFGGHGDCECCAGEGATGSPNDSQERLVAFAASAPSDAEPNKSERIDQ
jgi:hypothetical protein